MSLRDIPDWNEWLRDSSNLYCGRSNAVLGDNGFGNNFRVSDYGRDQAIVLYKQQQLPLISDAQLNILRSKKQLACWCTMDQDCHVSELIAYL